MSYLSQSQLEADTRFQNRTRAALTQQSLVFKDDGREDIAALAGALLHDDPGTALAFQRMVAGSPGFADKVDNGDGTVDSTKVTDAELLAAVQAEFPTVAGLFFTDDGSTR